MSLEARGTLFVAPGMETYDGMIVGEHSRDTDLDVNPVRTKELTNIRAPGKDENVRLSPSCLELMKGVNQVEVSSNPFDTTLLAAQREASFAATDGEGVANFTAAEVESAEGELWRCSSFPY